MAAFLADGPAWDVHGLRRRRGDVPLRAEHDRLQGPREDLRDRRARRRAALGQPEVRARAGRAAARRPRGDHAGLPPQQAPLEHRAGRRQPARAPRARHGRGLLRPRRRVAAQARARRSRLAMTTVLVTGATDGLGRVVAHDLAARGLDVLVHGRSAERADAVAREIGAAGVHLADFSVLDDVRALAAALPHVDVLVNNAGLISEERIVTGDGIELTFQVNHLAPFLDTKMVRSRVGRPANAVQTGADATVRLAADLDLDVHGRYFDVLEEARADEMAYDPDARKRLWDVSEQLLA